MYVLYYVAVALEDQNAIQGPSFVTQPADILYQVLDSDYKDDTDYDDTVTFKCEATGFPEPHYQWYTRINDQVNKYNISDVQVEQSTVNMQQPYFWI